MHARLGRVRRVHRDPRHHSLQEGEPLRRSCRPSRCRPWRRARGLSV